MALTIITKERTRSFTVFLICTAILLLFVLIVLYPRYKILIEKEFYISKLKHQIADQKELIPQIAVKMQEAEQARLPEGLVLPNKSPLTSEEKEKLPQMLEELAIRYHLKPESIVPETDSGGNEAVFLSLTVFRQQDKNDFFQIYPFLTELGKAAYVERFERISIRAVNEIRKVEIRIRLVRK